MQVFSSKAWLGHPTGKGWSVSWPLDMSVGQGCRSLWVWTRACPLSWGRLLVPHVLTECGTEGQFSHRSSDPVRWQLAGVIAEVMFLVFLLWYQLQRDGGGTTEGVGWRWVLSGKFCPLLRGVSCSPPTNTHNSHHEAQADTTQLAFPGSIKEMIATS